MCYFLSFLSLYFTYEFDREFSSLHPLLPLFMPPTQFIIDYHDFVFHSHAEQ